jgi:biopolymer transport protein ExbD
MTRAAKRLRAKAHGAEEDPEFQVAPMVDVLLVLMIFFMSITSTEVLRNVRGVELPGASNATPKPKGNQVVVNLSWFPLARQSNIEMDQVKYPNADALSGVLRGRKEKNASIRVLIRADKGVEFSYVADVMKACSTAGIANVQFAVIQGGTPGSPGAAPTGGEQ